MTETFKQSETGATDAHSGDREALDRSLIHGIAWTGGMKWATQILSWVATLIIARILNPTAYGLMGMAMVYLGFIHLVNQFGVGEAIVQRKELSRAQIAQLGGFSITVGVFFFMISVALAQPVASFFNEPAVREMVMVLSINLVTSSFKILPRSLLRRELRFRNLAFLDGLQAVVLSSVTLVLALLGFSYWALVLGAVVAEIVGTALAFVFRPCRFALPRRFELIKGEVKFGWHVVVSQISWYAYTHADFAVVGRMLGSVALGGYSIGWSVASVPVEKVSVLINQVTPSILAKVQDQPQELGRYLKRLTEGLAIVTFPASIGMALVAGDFVTVVLGAKWEPAIQPLRILALYGGFRSISVLMPEVLVATDHTKKTMQFSLVAAFVMPMFFLLGSLWGTTGVAMGWVVGYPLVVIPLFYRTALEISNMSALEFMGSLWPAISSSAVMAAGVVSVKLAAPDTWPGVTELALQVVAGAVLYIGSLFFLHRGRVRAFRQVVRLVRSDESAASLEVA